MNTDRIEAAAERIAQAEVEIKQLLDKARRYNVSFDKPIGKLEAEINRLRGTV